MRTCTPSSSGIFGHGPSIGRRGMSACPIGRIIAIDPAPNPQNRPARIPTRPSSLPKISSFRSSPRCRRRVLLDGVRRGTPTRRRALLDNASSTPTSTVIVWTRGGCIPASWTWIARPSTARRSRSMATSAVEGAPLRSGRDRRIGLPPTRLSAPTSTSSPSRTRTAGNSPSPRPTGSSSARMAVVPGPRHRQPTRTTSRLQAGPSPRTRKREPFAFSAYPRGAFRPQVAT